jgi:hypothetical protein
MRLVVFLVLSEDHIRKLMVQPGQDWDGDNDTGPLDRPTQGRILAQRQVRARLIVIRRIRRRCDSPRISSWPRHLRRTVPIRWAFAGRCRQY